MRRLAVISLHTSPLDMPGIGDSGGMNVYVGELVTALVSAGVECDVYVRRSNSEQPDVVEVTPGYRIIHVTAGPMDLKKDQLPEILDEFADAVEPLIAASGADAIHAHYWLSGVVGHTLKHRLNRPLVATFHTLERVKALSGSVELSYRSEAEAAVVGCCDVILANTPTEASELVELYGATPERIEVLAPGVDHDHFSQGSSEAARSTLGIGADPLMLFVGRIQCLKGLDLAVETLAASRFDDLRLIVVGGPSGLDGFAALQEAEDRAHELGVAERVRWVHPLPHYQLAAYYRSANVCVVPSRSESFGLVALEAAACALPVVAADVGGLSEVVRHGETGFLVRKREASHYSVYVDEILSNPELAQGLGHQAVLEAAKYSWDSAATQLVGLYSGITAGALVSCL